MPLTVDKSTGGELIIMDLRVWAPKAGEVRIQFGADEFPMRRLDRGWWSIERERPEAAEYAFVLDHGAPLPDPRSPWQPWGVHGPSRTVDHGAFPWTDATWQAPPLSGAVMYELHIGTFTPRGTFEAAIERLPYLKELGVTHVELMPVAQFPGEWGWGYDGVDLFAPHQPYGGPEGLKRLVDALHAHGLAAILDVVYNHLGPDGNYLSQFGPYYTARFGTPWGEAVNLCESGSDDVRRFFIENAEMWLRDYHFDALRLDAVHSLIDESATHFLEELAERVSRLEASLGRHLCLIAESDSNDPRLIRPRELGGYGLSAQWSDDFHHALHTVLTGERDGYYCDFGSMGALAKALERGFVYDGCYSEYRVRAHGRPLPGGVEHKLVVCLQNHDQVGNRAQGERIGALVSDARAKVGAAIVLTSRFIPLLFQGEEWGASSPFQYFTNHTDPELGKAVSEGRRREFVRFGWAPELVPDPQDKETFLRSKLDWSELARPAHREMLEWYRRLIALRKRVPAITSAETSVRFDEREKWLAIERGPITIACNLSEAPRAIPCREGRELLLASDGEPGRPAAGAVAVTPDSVAILGEIGAPGVMHFLSHIRGAEQTAPR